MVDSISSNNTPSINDLQSNPLLGNQTVGRINRESAQGAEKADTAKSLDQADISEAALARLASEKEVSHFARLAVRQEESFNADKVAQFKTMLDSGRINDYLRSLNNDDLAQSLLDSPVRAALI